MAGVHAADRTDWDECAWAQWRALTAGQDRLDEQLEPNRQFTDEQRQAGGVIVSIGGSREPVNSRGLMRPQDVREVERAKNADAVRAELSGTLRLDLHAVRQDALKAKLVNAQPTCCTALW